MTMSARMVVLMTPTEKQAIERRARSHRITPSEWIRQAAREYDPTEDEAALTLIAEEIEASAERMKRRLDESIAYADARMADIRALREAHGLPVL